MTELEKDQPALISGPLVPGAGLRRLTVVVFLLLLAMCLPAAACAGDSPLLLGFRGDAGEDVLPEGWELVSYFGRQGNRFFLEPRKPGEASKAGEMALRLHSLNSMSALMVPTSAAPDEYPVLSWHWKVNRAVGMAREDQRDRNDSAARVRVIFGPPVGEVPDRPPPVSPTGYLLRRFLDSGGQERGRPEPGGRKIDYIWGNHFPAGTVLDYPGGRDHRVVLLQSGNEKAGQWIREERDLLRDYRQFFGEMPRGIAAILVLSDTDRTNEGVTAWFAELSLGERNDGNSP